MGPMAPSVGSPICNYEELNLIASGEMQRKRISFDCPSLIFRILNGFYCISGAYGTVYRARVLDTGEIVALKKVRIPLTDEGNVNDIKPKIV